MNKKPKLKLINERNVFLRNGFNEPIPCKEEELNEDKICKIQKLSDLTRTKHVMNLTEQNGYYSVGVGNNCYLFIENDEIKIKTMEDHLYIKTFDTKYGFMMTENEGEWGGHLYNLTDKGLELAGYGNYIYVFEYNDKVYAITSSSHMGCYECSLYEIKKYDDRFEEITIFEANNLNFAGYYADENYFYFCSDSYYFKGLCRFNLDNNQFEIIEENFFGNILINSLIKKDNFVYIYGNHNIIEYDLNKGNIKTYTNLEYDDLTEYLYVDDVKLIGIWNDLIIK